MGESVFLAVRQRNTNEKEPCVYMRETGAGFGLPAQTSFFLEARGGRDSSAVRLPGWCCCRLCHEASPEERRAGEMAAKRML